MKFAITTFLFFLTTLSLASESGSGQKDALDNLFREYSGDLVPGAAVLVIKDGSVIESRVYGAADPGAGTPVTPATNFRLASVSKQFTAMAVMILADRGMLNLDDAVRHHIPDFPGYASGVKIIHLLNHTSGLRDYEDHIPRGQTSQLKDRDVVAILKRLSSTYFQPGTSWRYSNSGYATLAHLVEVVGGMRYSEFVKDNIFTPLGMDASVAYENGINEVPDRAFGHSPAGNGFTRTDQSITSAVLGDGGIYTSLNEYALWDAALYGSSIISNTALAKMFEQGQLNNGSKVAYGLGWKLDVWNGVSRVSHTGSTIGFRTSVVRFPTKKLTVAVFVNRANASPWDKADQVARMYW
jgi:CubicO group peptidase (beta-lactamase class C family)